MNMSPTRPYLLRAFYQWIVDNNCTPYLIAKTNIPNVTVPMEYSENNQIILNIGTTAVCNLLLNNDHVSFAANFKGITHSIYIPIEAILGIYAKETNSGTVFSEDDLIGLQQIKDKKSTIKKKPNLTVIK